MDGIQYTYNNYNYSMLYIILIFIVIDVNNLKECFTKNEIEQDIIFT